MPPRKKAETTNPYDDPLFLQVIADVERKRKRMMSRFKGDDDDDEDAFRITRVVTELPNGQRGVRNIFYDPNNDDDNDDNDDDDEIIRGLASRPSSRKSSRSTPRQSSSTTLASTSSTSSGSRSAASLTTTAVTADDVGIYTEYGHQSNRATLDEQIVSTRAYRALYQVKAVITSPTTKKTIYREFIISATILFKNLNELLSLLFGWSTVEDYHFSYEKDGVTKQIVKRASKNNLGVSSAKFCQVCPYPGNSCTWHPNATTQIELTVDVINTDGNLECVPRCVGLNGKLGLDDAKEGTLNETDTNIDRVNSKVKGKRFAANSASNRTKKQGVRMYVSSGTSQSEINQIANNVFRSKLYTPSNTKF